MLSSKILKHDNPRWATSWATIEELSYDNVKTTFLKTLSILKFVHQTSRIWVSTQNLPFIQKTSFPEQTFGQSSDYDDHVENHSKDNNK